MFGKLYILYNANDTPARQRFSIMHELGHCLLGHLDDGYHAMMSKDKEDAAERFAADMLMPACVLWGLNIHTADDIATLCDVSAQAAQIRAKRMKVLYKRNMFLSHPLEQVVFEQFREFIDRKSKEKRNFEEVFKFISSASDALKNAPFVQQLNSNVRFVVTLLEPQNRVIMVMRERHVLIVIYRSENNLIQLIAVLIKKIKRYVIIIN